MKRFFAMVCFLVVLLSGCTAKTTTTEETRAETMLPKDKTYQILFIGNSYTFYNEMPVTYFESIATNLGYDVRVTSVTKGAYTLEKFADPSDVYGSMVKTALNGGTQYDYVILQEQSVRPAVSPEAFYDGVRALNEQVRAIGAQPILYATWGRKEGSDTLEKYAMTSEEMTWKLAAAYDAIGQELEIPVAHVGLVFKELRAKTSMELYNPDKSHPSHAGSYVAAMSLFYKIFGADLDAITIQGPTAGDEATVRETVRSVLNAPPQIPDDYKTNSTGVTAQEG